MLDQILTAKLDANEVVFFQRQLEQIKSKTFDVQYPMLRAKEFIPVSTEINTGASVVVYHVYDRAGLAKIVADYAKDFPRVDVIGSEIKGNIRSVGDHYGYSIQEIRQAAYAGTPLETRRASAARQAIEEAMNRIAFVGDAAYGLYGLLNHPGLPRATVAADGNQNGGVNSTLWSKKTAAQILRDMHDLWQGVITLTKGVEKPNTILLPLSQYGLANTMQNSLSSDLTVLEFFKRNHPGVSVEWAFELAGAGTGGVDVMIAYDRSPNKLEQEIPQMFEQFPPQEEAMEFKVYCHARHGGTRVYYPLSVSIGEGI